MIAALLLAVLAGDPASIAVESDRKEYYLGEPVPVRIRIVIDGKFLAENAVPLTLRRTDVPVLVEAPWLKGLPAGPGDATLAVNDDVVAARRQGNGTASIVLVLDRVIRPEKAGDLELAAPVLRFARATLYEEDALGTRIPLDRTEGSVKGAPLTIRILPLPAEGRPAAFSGGVGRFTMTASVDAAEVEGGKSLHVILTVTGDGDLAAIAPPRLDGLAGFHVFGRLDGGDASKRTFTYEISPLDAGVTAVPPIAIETFDPTPPAGYRTVRTSTIPLSVRAAPPAPASLPPEKGKGNLPGPAVLAVAVAIAAALLLGRRLRR